jgi:hypothetical protein
VLTGRITVACCFGAVAFVTEPGGDGQDCGDDYEVSATKFRRFGRMLGTGPGQRTTGGTDNESRAC